MGWQEVEGKRSRQRIVPYRVTVPSTQARKLKVQTRLQMQGFVDRYLNSKQAHTLVGLRNAIGISKKTWDSYFESVKYSDILELAKQQIEEELEVNALQNSQNVPMTQFTLKNNFGWVDSQEITSKNLNVNVEADAKLGEDFMNYLKQKTLE